MLKAFSAACCARRLALHLINPPAQIIREEEARTIKTGRGDAMDEAFIQSYAMQTTLRSRHARTWCFVLITHHAAKK